MLPDDRGVTRGPERRGHRDPFALHGQRDCDRNAFSSVSSVSSNSKRMVVLIIIITVIVVRCPI